MSCTSASAFNSARLAMVMRFLVIEMVRLVIPPSKEAKFLASNLVVVNRSVSI